MPDIFKSEEMIRKAEKTPVAPPDKSLPEKQLENIAQARYIPPTEIERMRSPFHTHNPLAAYSLYPDPGKVMFETKDEKEEVILFLRQHPIVNLKWVAIAVLMVLAPAISALLPIFSSLPINFQIVAVLSWYLVTMAFVLENFLDWFFNIYIVTNERVVDIDFSNLIYKKVSDADLDKIQDVSYVVGGVLRTILDYGDVLIQTAAEVSEFDFLAVPNPDKVTKMINELKMQEEKEKTGHK